MRVYDCFLFRDELEVLDLRLKIHSEFVSRFILCEAPVTFDGRAKPLHYAENVSRFADYSDMIHGLVADHMPWPVSEGPLVRGKERIRLFYAQQDQLSVGLVDADDDDVVLFSDVDEMVRPTEIPRALGMLDRYECVCIGCGMYYYYLNGHRGDAWRGPLMFRVGAFRRWRTSMSKVFLRRKSGFEDVARMVRYAGWHFSYLGGPAQVVEKLRAGGSWAYAKTPYTDEAYIRRMMDEGRLFQNGRQCIRYVPIGDEFPREVRENRAKYAHLIREGLSDDGAVLTGA